MSNFSKQETVAFEQILEGFEDAMVMSHNVNIYKTDPTIMERSGDQIWRPQPYVAKSFDGSDQTGNFGSYTQLSVPATIGYHKSVPWSMTATELRDMLQEKRLGDSARQKIGSDVNRAVLDAATAYGSVVVKRTTAASGYDDVAEASATFDELGINEFDRRMALSARDYNGMASNLAARQTINEKPTAAYEKSYVGDVAGFETFKLNYTNRLTAAAGTTVTINGANQYYVPAATSTAATGERSNVDNRFQDLAITVGGGTVKVGDCFTIAGVYAVHHITKQATSQLKTFRITAIKTGAGGTGTITITPAIVSNGGSTLAEEIYKNVDSTPANGAAIVFLNTAAAYMNPFWTKDSIELLPGTIPVQSGSGAEVMRGATSQGIELVMIKFLNNKTLNYEYRFDSRFGVVNLNPEMSGIMLFSQS